MRFVLPESTRLAFAADSLAGLSVGDALGAQYFTVGPKADDLLRGEVPPPVWEWTDDTEMACSVYWLLQERQQIDQDLLAEVFAERCEPNRGYGMGAFIILHAIRRGESWQAAARAAFDGQGSCGNGAAMRVAPVGAYFPDSPERAAAQAALSARVTHAHPEGVAGAMAVSVAASLAVAGRLAGVRPKPGPFLDGVLAHTPFGTVRDGIAKARKALHLSIEEIAYRLGNGSNVTAQDTVPFTLWAAAKHLDDYPAAISACAVAGGDIDTTSAIVGGVVAAYTGVAGIPPHWLSSREPLPTWLNEIA